MRLSWIADALRSEGLDVLELPGWKGRGKELTTVRGIVQHNTVTSPATADGNVDKLLRDGRPDLAGPLCQLGLRRSGTFVAVADGIGNHNGYGLWGNESLGIEVYNDGYDEPWSAAQVSASEIGSAVICRRLGLDPLSQVKGHRETDPKRKVDPRLKQVDLDALRLRIAVRLGSTTPTEDDMFTDADRELLARINDKTEHNRWNRDVLDGISAAVSKIAAGDGASATEILDQLAERLKD